MHRNNKHQTLDYGFFGGEKSLMGEYTRYFNSACDI